MLPSAEELDVRGVGRNHLRAAVGIQQIAAPEMVQVGLAVVALADQAPWRVAGKGLESGAELPAFALDFHAGDAPWGHR